MAERLAAGIVLALALACAGDPGEPVAKGAGSGLDLRSVLLLTLDTTRADRLGAYGADGVETPSLDALAAQGVLFERALAVAPITAPAHASLFTGLYPPRHGVRDNGIHYLPRQLPTLAETLLAAGYRTAAFVSAAVLERRYGLDRGFEVYDDDLTAGGSRRQARMMIERPAAATVERAAAWLDGLGEEEPFLLWVHLFDPHAPYAPPKPFSEAYSGRPYDGEVAYMDSQIGRLLRHPRVATEATLVVAMGDHGESLGDHGETTHGLLIYEATLRVPWILRLPGGPRGLRVAEAVSQVDLLPTLIEALELPPMPSPTDGRSLLPLLAGEPLERTLYAETEAPFRAYGWVALRSVRDDRRKYIAAPEAELYDLQKDPGETVNLALEEVAEVERLATALERHLAGTREPREELERDALTAARLAALGYVGSADERPEGGGEGDPKLLIGVHEELQRTAGMLTEGQDAEAVRRLRGLLERNPGNLEALRQLARGLVQSGRLTEAAAVALQAREAAPWSASARLAQADVAFRRGDAEAALALADEALALDPRFFEARLERARFLAYLGRRDEAAKEFESLAGSGASAWLQLRWAEALELPAGRLAEAEERLLEAVTLDPYLAEGWLRLGEALAGQGKAAEAMSVYRRGLEVNEGDPRLELALALALAASGDPAGEAEAIWRSHLERYPLSAQPWINLASLALQRRQWPEAERLAARAAEIDPGMASAWNAIAIAAEEQGRTEDAAAAYRRAVEVDPRFWRARLNLGSLLRQEGRLAAAVEEFEWVLRQVPGQPAAHLELGLLYAGPLADALRAREHLHACIREAPGTPRAAEAARALELLERGAG